MKKLSLLFSLLLINPLVAQVQLGGDIDGEYPGDESGAAVSLSSDGTIVAVGAYFNDDNGSNAGQVRVYEYNSGSWTQLGSDIDGEAENDHSGVSVALSADGTIVAIGEPGYHGSDTCIGRVRVYEFITGSWTQLGGGIDGETSYDFSGNSVSLSSDGNIIAIGAYFNDGDDTINSQRGHVRVYEYSNGNWTQLGLDIDGEAVEDWSGGAVSLSSDGTILAIGAQGNDGTDTLNSDRGHVRVFQFSNGIWTQLCSDIDGEAAYDRSGSVSVCSDGTTVAIGAYGNDGNGSYSGHVRVYSIGGNTAGVNSTALEYNLEIYPNPTNDYLILDIPEEIIGQQYGFVITNAAGQSMYSDFLYQAQLQINLKNFASSGTHTLQIKDSGGNVVDTRVIILQ